MEKNINLEKLKTELIENNYNYLEIQEYLKYAEALLNHDLPVIFNKHHLLNLIGWNVVYFNNFVHNTDQFYNEFKIPKKNGSFRIIEAPKKNLCSAQKWILDNILYKFPVSKCCHGFCKEKSILTNALEHVNQECIINLDLKDFFPSINENRIFHIFYYYGYTQKVSYFLTKLCTLNKSLPQGAPTSPYLSNLVC